jgi:hypothetical protein
MVSLAESKNYFDLITSSVNFNLKKSWVFNEVFRVFQGGESKYEFLKLSILTQSSNVAQNIPHRNNSDRLFGVNYR